MVPKPRRPRQAHPRRCRWRRRGRWQRREWILRRREREISPTFASGLDQVCCSVAPGECWSVECMLIVANCCGPTGRGCCGCAAFYVNDVLAQTGCEHHLTSPTMRPMLPILVAQKREKISARRLCSRCTGLPSDTVKTAPTTAIKANRMENKEGARTS